MNHHSDRIIGEGPSLALSQMYGPAPPRLKKTGIVRSRNGCRLCRERRKKCDERKPACGSCLRLGKQCEPYGNSLEFRQVSFRHPSPCVDQEVPRSERYLRQRTSSHTTLEGDPLSDPTNDYSSQDDCPSSINNNTEVPTPTSVDDAPEVSTTAASLIGAIIEPGMHEFLCGASSLDPFTSNNITRPQLSGSQDAPLINGLPPTPSSTTRPSSVILLHDQSESASVNLIAGHSQSRSINKSDHHHSIPGSSPLNDTVLSLESMRKTGQRIFYLDVWQKRCSPALHSAFQTFALAGHIPPVVVDAMMALSACQLSRMLPQKKSFGISDTPGMAFRPDPSHGTVSQELYGAALRNIASWDRTDPKCSSTTTLAVSVLFCYLESAMGNFRDFNIHSAGVQSLLHDCRLYVANRDLRDAELLAAWVQANAHNWWLRFHFSTPDFLREQAYLHLQPNHRAILATTDSRRALVLSNLCESYRLSSLALMHNWTPSNGTESFPHSTTEPRSNDTCPLPVHGKLLGDQRKNLDDWHASLMLFELPIESFHDAPLSINCKMDDLNIQPLRFNTHSAAMNYAYYVVARVMQCDDLLRGLQPNGQTPSNHDLEETDSWIALLLRIASGLDWDDCLQFNVYTVGFSGLLLACALRTSNLAAGLWIQDWLEQRYTVGSLEEGSFPVLQILQVLRALNRERGKGHDMFVVFQPFDDGGGIGKYDSYNSQRISSIMMYGRCRNTCQLLLREVSL
ncbi:hypothetical protein EDB80DRAFT_713418 [Ilyonectria destructans]|nr:hypothetical protein EDB80DRAFT_713418 [Ilyonectria destructans]